MPFLHCWNCDGILVRVLATPTALYLDCYDCEERTTIPLKSLITPELRKELSADDHVLS